MEAPSTNRLVIPCELASASFPRYPETLKFTDSQNKEWHWPVKYYSDERGFMILKGWQQFSTQNNLQPMDLIRIYEHVPRRDWHHFLIQVEKKQGTVEMPMLKFIEENFLFHIELDEGDGTFERVLLERDNVTNFLGVEMQRNSGQPELEQKQMTMRFTDAKCKDWYMTIIRYDEGRYMVNDGWKDFVEERGLKAGDLVRFYAHGHPRHEKHFLIGIVKKEGQVNPGQPGGGSGAGPDTRSGSGSYKGKEITGGDYKGKKIAGGD